jgi:hypothetical protein
MKGTHLSFPLAQDRIRGAGPCLTRRCRALGHFGIAAGMIYTTSDLGRVLPDPVLDIFRPGRFKFLLADGARGVAESGIVRGSNPRLWWLLLSIAIHACSSFGGGLGIRCTILVASFPRFDPVLLKLEMELVEIHEMNIPSRQHTSCDSEPVGRTRSCADWS